MLEFDDIKASKILKEIGKENIEVIDGYVSFDTIFKLLVEFANKGAIIAVDSPYYGGRDAKDTEIKNFIEDCSRRRIEWWSSIAKFICICMDFLNEEGIASKFLIHETEKPLKGEEYDLRVFLKIKYTKPITIKGHFYLQQPMSTEERAHSTKLTVEGTFYLHNSTESMDINIPANLKVPPFELKPFRPGSTPIHYNSAAEYNNRESRVARLEENKRKRDAMKDALANGLISHADSYGMPLEINCTVAFYSGGRVKIGKVEGQTLAKVICREPNAKWASNCYPTEVARIL